MTLSTFKGCSKILCINDKGYDGSFLKGLEYTVVREIGDNWLEVIDNNDELYQIADIHLHNDFVPIDKGEEMSLHGLSIYFQLRDIVSGDNSWRL